jgi:cobalt/nickel transport system permease protein
MSPLAVHIADGALDWPVLAAGFLGAALLALPGLVRVREEEIPRLALMTAAFFVTSTVSPPLPLHTSVHLLLNGLLGVMLGIRAGLAILVGLLFQYAFLGHGGIGTLGVNTCVLTIPALATAGLFRLLDRPAVSESPVGRGALVFASAFLMFGSLAVTAQAIAERLAGRALGDTLQSLWVLRPIGLIVLAGVSGLLAVSERRWEDRPGFPLGCLLGITSVLMTVALLAAVLVVGMPGVDDGPIMAIVLAHLPVAAVEGIVLGSVVAFLTQVRPDLLGRRGSRPAQREQLVKADLPLAESDAHDR